jgi:transcriptional regulator with XRE-family HTH domain
MCVEEVVVMAKNWIAMADPEIVKEICQAVKQMRINKNISQQQIAEMSGLDRTTISRMETGRAVNILTLVQVLRALDKLDILNVFSTEQVISPIRLLKEEERKRKRAGKTKKGVQNKEKEGSQW